MTALHCYTPQHTTPHCNTLQHTGRVQFVAIGIMYWIVATHCNALQHTATHCNTLQHTGTETLGFRPAAFCCTHIPCIQSLPCNKLQHTAKQNTILQHTGRSQLAATSSHVLNHYHAHILCCCRCVLQHNQHTAPHYNTLPYNTLHHTAQHCNTPSVCNSLPSRTMC